MAMNTQKVLIGGLAAGVVLNIIDYLAYGVILAARMTAETNAFMPGLQEKMMSGSAIARGVIFDFIIGILLVWTYAAIRPRFGPGMQTAAYAAIVFWIFGSITTSGYAAMGMMSMGTYWEYGIIWLINLLLAAWVGGRIYSESDATIAA